MAPSVSPEAAEIEWQAGPVVRPSLHEEVVSILRDMILEAKLAPGSRIAELQLCRRLGVSRTPLREALKVLASEQLVELLPYRGAVVSKVTVKETAELFETLEGLEIRVGELAAQRVTEAQLAEIQDLHREMLGHHRRARRAEYFACNQRIHRRLVEIAGNATLAAIHLDCSRKIMRARYAANFSQLRWSESAREHGEIVAALEKRDGASLSRLLREHIRRTADTVIAAMRSAEGASIRTS